MDFKTRLKDLRLENDITQDDLAKKLNLTNANISKYENGRIEPNFETLLTISSLFGCSTDYLLGRSDERNGPTVIKTQPKTPTNKTIPILGTIRAGIPIMASDNFDGELDLGSEYHADFALRITGDSMSWAGIHSGDIALLRHAEVAHHGDIVAAGMVDGDWTATLKYYISNNGSPLLRPANPDYKDITLDDRYRIIGVVMHVIKDSPSLGEYNTLLAAKQLADSEWVRVIEAATGKGITPTALSGFMEVMQMMVNSGKK